MPATCFKSWKRVMPETPLIDIRPDHWAIVYAILQRHVPQYAVWAFGSRAKWKAKEYSDLDLAIITDQPLSLDVSASLSEDLSESDLPYKVDVVDWATTSESFRKIIERDKVVVQKAKKNLGMANDWQEFLLSDIADLSGGFAFKSSDYAESGRFVLRTLNIADDGSISRDDAVFLPEYLCAQYSRFELQPSDTLFVMVGATLGKVGFIREKDLPALMNQNMWLIRAKPEVADPRFIHYAFRHFIKESLGWASGSARSFLRRDDTRNLRIIAPNLGEQRAIAHILGTLDDKIELNRKQNETLEAMARTLFKAWFVDFEPVRAKMEGRWQRGQSLPGLPAHLYDNFPDRLIESESEEIPKGWEMQPLSELLTIIGGGTPKTSIEDYWGGDIPWFSVVDTPPASDVFVVATEKNITAQGLAGSSARLIQKGTTIISARGTVGNLAIAGCDMTFNQSCYGLCGTGGAGDYFVYLTAQQMVDQLKSMAHGSVFSTITRQTFEAIQRPVPPQGVLVAFERSVKGWFDSILVSVEESRTLAQIRDTLLPKLISGELRVPDAERIVESVK